MKPAAVATATSIAVHAIAFVLLSPRSQSPVNAPISVSVLPAPHRDEQAAATAQSPAASTVTPTHVSKSRRSTLRRSKITPSPSTTAEPAPIGPPAAESVSNETDTDDDDQANDSSVQPAEVANGSAGVASTQSTADLARPPGLDRDSCIRRVAYPFRAKLLDKEGVVRLRVVVGADGHVTEATVLERAGYGFDETALQAVKVNCQFSPARDSAGKSTSFVIANYHFYFKLGEFHRVGNHESPRQSEAPVPFRRGGR